MSQRAESASTRGAPYLEALDRLVWLQLRVIRLERKLERLRRREDAVFRAFHRLVDAEEDAAIVAWRHRMQAPGRTGDGPAGG